MSMRKAIFFATSIIFISSIALARPPQDMLLNYDAEKGLLEIDMRHISDDANRDYIRKIVMYVNGNEEGVKYNRKQVDPARFKESFEFLAKDGDVIKIKAYCSDGGVGEAELAVVIETKDEASSGRHTGSFPDAQQDGINKKDSGY